MKKIDLSGTWKVYLDQEDTGIQDKLWEHFPETVTIQLPTTLSEATIGVPSEERAIDHLTDPYLYEGAAWYKREIVLEEVYEEVLLRFERTRMSTVWINGQLAGSGNSLCTPHQFTVTDYLRKGINEIVVRIDNLHYPVKGGHMTSPDTQTNWNGILGEICFEVHKTSYLQTIRLETCNLLSKGELKVNLQLMGEYPMKALASVENHEIQTYLLNPGENELIYMLPEDLKEWDEYSTKLYDLKLQLTDESDEKWEEEQYCCTFGIREFHATGHYFTINGVRTFLRGKHDGMVFPLTGYAPMEVTAWEDVFETAKEYGINHYRFHTCCPPEAAFAAADRVGIYLSPELPFWGDIAEPGTEKYDGVSEQYLIEEGYRILDTYGNHPSFVMMSMGNELWGSPKRVNEIVGLYRQYDSRHLYTQGSNNFQFTPSIAENEDYFCGVRFSKDRLFRGSYAMCDAPQGHIQTAEPDSDYDYDEMIRPAKEQITGENETGNEKRSEDTPESEQEITIQFGTGTKTVKGSKTQELYPELPVVSHEVGQYTFYPDFKEIEKYTGVCKAYNMQIMQEHLKEKGMLPMAERFFQSAGEFACACYKAEIETALSSKELAGFQLLDLQDFPGQGTALVGILNAFLENKGLITAVEWRRFCAEDVLLGVFHKFIYQSGEVIPVEVMLSAFGQTAINANRIYLSGRTLSISCGGGNTEMACDVDTRGQKLTHGVFDLGRLTWELPKVEEPVKYQLSLHFGKLSNQYTFWVYPDLAELAIRTGKLGIGQEVVVTEDETRLHALLQSGKKVLYYPQETNTEEYLEGTYCTDFWCYPMFRGISESVGRKVPVGTMGLCIDAEHAIFKHFPTESFSTPQWYEIVSNGSPRILDETDITPIVWTIDNFERNHKLGNLWEIREGTGRAVVCTTDLRKLSQNLPAAWLQYSILSYLCEK